MIKLILLLVVALVVALATAPLWGGCEFNYDVCSLWCDLRHLGSDIERVACEANCAADRLSCMAQ